MLTVRSDGGLSAPAMVVAAQQSKPTEAQVTACEQQVHISPHRSLCSKLAFVSFGSLSLSLSFFGDERLLFCVQALAPDFGGALSVGLQEFCGNRYEASSSCVSCVRV